MAMNQDNLFTTLLSRTFFGRTIFLRPYSSSPFPKLPLLPALPRVSKGILELVHKLTNEPF